jgi:hypothetical protein
MFVRDSSAAAEPPPLSAHLPKHGERRGYRNDPNDRFWHKADIATRSTNVCF